MRPVKRPPPHFFITIAHIPATGPPFASRGALSPDRNRFSMARGCVLHPRSRPATRLEIRCAGRELRATGRALRGTNPQGKRTCGALRTTYYYGPRACRKTLGHQLESSSHQVIIPSHLLQIGFHLLRNRYHKPQGRPDRLPLSRHHEALPWHRAGAVGHECHPPTHPRSAGAHYAPRPSHLRAFPTHGPRRSPRPVPGRWPRVATRDARGETPEPSARLRRPWQCIPIPRT